ncbi:MAG: MerR family transcriptional regulator, partial [Chitinophagaceae bacterium]
MASFQQIALEFDASQQNAASTQKAAEQPLPKSSRGRKSLKAAEEELSLVQVPEDEVLFKKHYYSIGEVATMLNV